MSASSRFGFVAVIGAPNAGKSTLVNRLVGSKVSIVTPKVQTTRTRVRGVAVKDDAQIVFVDTPGIFAPRRLLDRAMVDAAWAGAADADQIVVLVDAAREAAEPDGRAADDTRRIVVGLRDAGRRAVLALNKIDGMRRDQLLPLAARLTADAPFDVTFMISAQTGAGVDDLLAHLIAGLKPGPWMYPADQAADIPMRQLAAEITREKLFLRLHDELPYASTVETEQWKALKDGSVRIEQTIYVERDGQKAIVLGKGGRTVKEIGEKARAEIAEIAGVPVHLFLFVKVRENWAEDPGRYREMGLDMPRSDDR